MTDNPTPKRDPSDLPYESAADSAAKRGTDNRRSTVNPADDPAPISPAPNEDVLRQSEEDLDRVKPY